MPAAGIQIGDLASRANRVKVTPGGIKRIAINQYRTRAAAPGGIAGFFLDLAGRFVGFVCQTIFGAVTWSLSTLWQWVCSAVQYIWTFDWNKSSETMDKELESAWNSFGGILGGAVGGTLGWLLVGAVGGSIMFMFNEALAVHALNEFGEEALEEITQKAASVIRAGSKLVGKALFGWAYKALRDRILGNPDDIYLTDEALEKAVTDGTMTQAIADKNKKGREAFKAENARKPWSFALKFEEWKESLPEGFVQNFVEEAFEEFFEAIQEGGYLLCQSMDSYYAQHTQAQNASIATQQRRHTISVLLNRDPDPIIVPPPAPAT